MFTFSFLRASVLIMLIQYTLGAFVPKFPIVNSTAPLASSTDSVASPTNISSCGYVLQTTQLHWISQSAPISTTTITAATHIIIIDPRTNKTSTTTLRNPRAPISTQAVDTNAGGTQITSLTFSDLVAQTNFTTVVAFPTAFVQYGYSYFLSGTLTETAGASSTKDISNIDIEFPSHPIYPPPAASAENFDINSDTDPRGLNFAPTLITGQDFNQDFYQTAFPNVPAVQSCICGGAFNFGGNGLPEVFVNQVPIASFITATSTSYATIADPTSAGPSSRIISTATPAASMIQTSAPVTAVTPSTLETTGATSSVIEEPRLGSSVVDFLTTTTPPQMTPTSSAVNIGSVIISLFNGVGNSFLAHVESSALGLGDPATSIDVHVQTPRISSDAEPSQTIQQPGPSSVDLIGPVLSSIIGGGPPVFTARIENSVAAGSSGLPDGAQENSQAIAITTEGPDGVTVVIAQPASSTAVPPQTLTIAGQTITQNSASAFVISGQTLAPGAPAVTLGQGSSTTVVSLATNAAGNTVVVVGTDSSTILPQATPAPATPPTLTIAGQTLTPSSTTDFVIGGQTLAPGGSPITLGNGVSTTVVSLATNSAGQTVLVVGGSSSTLTIPPTAGSGLTIGTLIATPVSNAFYVVESQTLTPGESLTLGSGASTTVVGLTTDAAGETVVVIGTSSSTLTPAGPTSAPLTVATTVVASGSTSITEYIIGSQTLFPGHPITLGVGNSTTVIALSTDSAGSTVLIVGSESTTLPGTGPTSSSSVGRLSALASGAITLVPSVGPSSTANGAAAATSAKHSTAAAIGTGDGGWWVMTGVVLWAALWLGLGG